MTPAKHNAKVTPAEHEALERLLSIGVSDTGQSRRVADFLLAWWNAGSCGAFDITTAWGLDSVIAEDVITVFALAVRCGSYPDTLGYSEGFERVIRTWRPELTSDPNGAEFMIGDDPEPEDGWLLYNRDGHRVDAEGALIDAEGQVDPGPEVSGTSSSRRTPAEG